MSTINAQDMQATLDEFESIFGIAYEDFALLDDTRQSEILYTKSASVDVEEVYSLFDEIYASYASLHSLYDEMLNQGNHLESAQASVYLQDMEKEYELSLKLSSLWGEQVNKSEKDSQESQGSDIRYEVDNPYDGQEITLNLQKSNADSKLWVADPNASDTNMCDSDGDGYKDTVFYSSSRTQYNATNLQGKTVNIDTDHDGDIDEFDGLDANTTELPVCTLDLNGASWELVDFDEETNYFRLKITSGEEPDTTESYINVYGPCYIVPEDGVQPDESILRSYSEKAMRAFKQSATSNATVGDLLYGKVEGSKSKNYIMDSSVLSNAANISASEDEFENQATITFNLESGERDDITIDCQNAEATFEWHGTDLHMFLTNDKGEVITYIFKNFETQGMQAEDADFLHLKNVHIDSSEMENLCTIAPGSRGDSNKNGIIEEELGEIHDGSYSVASSIYLTDEAEIDGEDKHDNSIYGLSHTSSSGSLN